MRTEEHIQKQIEFYKYLPKEFLAALAAGGEAETEGLQYYDEAIFIHIEDDEWITATMHTVYKTYSGRFYIEVFTDYTCGDSHFHKRYYLGDPETVESTIYEEYIKSVKKHEVEYIEWVAENGKDPLHYYFSIKETEARGKEYEFLFHPHIPRLEEGGGLVVWAGWRKPGKKKWKHPSRANVSLLEFLSTSYNPITKVYIVNSANAGLYEEPNDFTWEKLLGLNYTKVESPDDTSYAIKATAYETHENKRYSEQLIRMALKDLEECRRKA